MWRWSFICLRDREGKGMNVRLRVKSRIKGSGFILQSCREFGTLELSLRGRLGLEI